MKRRVAGLALAIVVSKSIPTSGSNPRPSAAR
jgi:hypothetical protein